MTIGPINVRSYDSGRSIFQSSLRAGYVDVRKQLHYLRDCLRLGKAGSKPLYLTHLRSMIEALEDTLENSKTEVTVASYRELRSDALQLQSLQIKLEHMRADQTAQVARMDELAKREHEMKLAQLRYGK